MILLKNKSKYLTLVDSVLHGNDNLEPELGESEINNFCNNIKDGMLSIKYIK